MLHYPREFRRTLLEASKSMIYGLQRYHKIKMIREEKRKHILQLKAQLREITFLLGKLKETLPAQTIAVPVHREKTPVVHEPPMPKPQAPAPVDELEKLSNNLSAIEDRLNRL